MTNKVKEIADALEGLYCYTDDIELIDKIFFNASGAEKLIALKYVVDNADKEIAEKAERAYYLKIEKVKNQGIGDVLTDYASSIFLKALGFQFALENRQIIAKTLKS